MPKKIKPTSLLDEDQGLNEAEAVNTEAIVDPVESGSLIGNGRLTNEDKEKLEKYDALEEAVKTLTEEKQILEDKVAEYVEKLNAVDVKKLNDEIASLKKQLDEAKKSAANENPSALKDECKKLRDEADGYLIKISELTFENANLTCQMNELKKNVKRSSSQPHSALAQPMKDAYNPYKNNGYGVW